jgi:hypothetical protein
MDSIIVKFSLGGWPSGTLTRHQRRRLVWPPVDRAYKNTFSGCEEQRGPEWETW